jgi:DNA-binding MarR family transcriptional regulator
MRLPNIGSLLKKIYRLYSQDLLWKLSEKGFTDLRPSFLEVLLAVVEDEGSSIKRIGHQLGLKKQTMTSHLNELERRNYIERVINPNDKREQKIILTEHGLKFRYALQETLKDLEQKYLRKISEVEWERVEQNLEGIHHKIDSLSSDKLV